MEHFSRFFLINFKSDPMHKIYRQIIILATQNPKIIRIALILDANA